MNLTFSIVTPSYNQGHFIAATIESVLEQNYPALDYRVMDAGSQDCTVEILRSYGKELWWISEPDQGQSDAINKGFQQSRGEILAWLNADDLYCPGALGLVAREFETDPDLMVVYGDAYHIDSEGKVLDKYPSDRFNLESLALGCFICQPACFFRRRLFETVGGLDTRLHFALDLDLWIRFGITKKSNPSWKFVYLPKLLAYSRMHQRNKTLANRALSLQDIIQVIERHFDIVPFNWVYALEEARAGNYDGYFARSPFKLSLFLKSVSKWVWMNRGRPNYLFAFVKDCVHSPRKSAKRLGRRIRTKV